MTNIHFVRIAGLAWLAGALAGVAQASTEPPQTLRKVQDKLDASFQRMDQNLARAAEKLATVDIQSAEARKILRDLYQSTPPVVDCSIVDNQGIMRVVEPAPCRKFEGADISQQAQIVTLHRTRRPILSSVFRAVEGFDAVDFECPIRLTS